MGGSIASEWDTVNVGRGEWGISEPAPAVDMGELSKLGVRLLD